MRGYAYVYLLGTENILYICVYHVSFRKPQRFFRMVILNIKLYVVYKELFIFQNRLPTCRHECQKSLNIFQYPLKILRVCNRK